MRERICYQYGLLLTGIYDWYSTSNYGGHLMEGSR